MALGNDTYSSAWRELEVLSTQLHSLELEAQRVPMYSERGQELTKQIANWQAAIDKCRLTINLTDAEECPW